MINLPEPREKRINMEHWIWLPQAEYPEKQRTRFSCLAPGEENYAVCELNKTCDFGGRQVRRVSIAVSGDTAFLLFANGRFLLRGPAGVGGDFLYNDQLRPEYYAYDHSFVPADPCAPLIFRALVRMGSVRICEYSRGMGGFALSGTVEFTNGETMEICAHPAAERLYRALPVRRERTARGFCVCRRPRFSRAHPDRPDPPERGASAAAGGRRFFAAVRSRYRGKNVFAG